MTFAAKVIGKSVINLRRNIIFFVNHHFKKKSISFFNKLCNEYLLNGEQLNKAIVIFYQEIDRFLNALVQRNDKY